MCSSNRPTRCKTSRFTIWQAPITYTGSNGTLESIITRSFLPLNPNTFLTLTRRPGKGLKLSCTRFSLSTNLQVHKPTRGCPSRYASIPEIADSLTIVSLSKIRIFSPVVISNPLLRAYATPLLHELDKRRITGNFSVKYCDVPSCEPLSTTITSTSARFIIGKRDCRQAFTGRCAYRN